MPLFFRRPFGLGFLGAFDPFWLGYDSRPYGAGYATPYGSTYPPDLLLGPPAFPPGPSPEPSLIQPPPSGPPQPMPSSAVGRLRVEGMPGVAQVYVDGFYAGTVEAISESEGLTAAVGWHRLEFRAAGYETLAVNVTFAANRTISYRGELRPTPR